MGWVGATKIPKQWLPLINISLGPLERHPAVHELVVFVDAAEEVSARLRAQSHHQPDMLAALIHLVQTEFNESFRKVFFSPLPVHWPHFSPLIRTLTTGHFWAIYVSMP